MAGNTRSGNPKGVSKKTSSSITNDFLLEKINLLEKSIELVSTKLESVISTNEEKDKVIKNLQKQNLQLSTEIENLEVELTNLNQYGRRECVEMTNIPESISQNQLEGHVVELLDKIGVKLAKSDLVAVHRLGTFKRGTNRVVIAKFLNRKNANLALKNKSKLSKIKSKVRIRENLCPERKSLFNRLYKMLKNDQIEDLWTKNGNIFCVFKNYDEPVIIEHKSDIDYYMNVENLDESDVDSEGEGRVDNIVNLNDISGNLRHWALKNDHVYIGRVNDKLPGIPDVWGNPYMSTNKNSKKANEKCLDDYKSYVKRSKTLMEKLPELKGMQLGCWCKNKHMCHGKVLNELYDEHVANESITEPQKRYVPAPIINEQPILNPEIFVQDATPEKPIAETPKKIVSSKSVNHEQEGNKENLSPPTNLDTLISYVQNSPLFK